MINAFEGETIEDRCPETVTYPSSRLHRYSPYWELRRMNELRAGLRGLLKGQICDAQIGKA